MTNPFPICVKTPKGIDEVERKTHRLPLKTRQVLIMIDGRRDLSALQGMFPPELVATILTELLAGEFIRPLPQPTPPPTPAEKTTARAAPVAANDEERYALARNFMLNTTSAFVGMVGSSLTAKIEAAIDLDALDALYGEWHKSIGLSAEGKKRLVELDTQLMKLLGDFAPPAASQAAEAAAVAAPAARPKDNDERLEMARSFMGNTIRTFIGIAGSTLIDRIDGTRTIGELRRLYYDWRESMQLSAEARRRLPDLELRIAALLS